MQTTNRLPGVQAYFQPIVSIDHIFEPYAFEVLGYKTDATGQIKALGDFFSDPSLSNPEVMAVDQEICRDAFRLYAESGAKTYLFLNIRLDWIARFIDKPSSIPTLALAREFDIDFSRLVIEITEEDFEHFDPRLLRIIDFCRHQGLRFAIDDFGKNASNIKRLSVIVPDIIKLDMDYIHRSEKNPYYREYLFAVTSFAERMGIEVLYEGVENERQLDICLASLGRYFQGFLFARPQPTMRDTKIDWQTILSASERLLSTLNSRAHYAAHLRYTWDQWLESILSSLVPNRSNLDIDQLFDRLLAELPLEVRHIYLCDARGIQLAPAADAGRPPHCLVWRRYFQKAVFAFASGHSSYLSNLYIDPVSKKKTHTYVYQLTPERFLFIDLNSRRPGSVIITQPKANTADFSGHNVPHLSFLDSELDDN